MPPTLDRLFERLEIEEDHEAQAYAYSKAQSFFQVLRRMNADEREAVISLIQYGCPSHLPDDLHINADLLRRYTGKSVANLKRLLGDVRSLGFSCTIREAEEEESMEWEGHMPEVPLGDAYIFYLRWTDLSIEDDDMPLETLEALEERLPPLVVASEMIAIATELYCEEHGKQFLERLDFSQLANATVSKEQHESEL